MGPKDMEDVSSRVERNLLNNPLLITVGNDN